jgi:hypothetical protein
MTGMKEGAGEDPFAEETTVSETELTEQEGSEDTEATDTEPASDSQNKTTDAAHSRRTMQIPYKFRRDGVQDGRDRVPLFLQKETKSAERDALRELEERFDDDVSLTDLREALMKVGLRNLDEAEVHLEEWGYGMTFD